MKNYMYVLFVALFLSCANIVSLTGGQVDDAAPTLVGSAPPNKSTNFKASSVLLEFDEYLQFKNKNIIRISPICEPPPTISIKGKKIDIAFLCSLDKDITYTINFGNSICDLNEGNALENFTYVFSTGQLLDTITINGSAKDAYSLEDINGAMIALYKTDEFSSPHYYTYTENGHFEFQNIKQDNYIIFGFRDDNQNLKYDVGEQVTNSFKIDGFNKNYDLLFFYEQNESEHINVYNTSKNSVKFEHGRIRDSIQILNNKGNWNYNDKSSEFWFNNSPKIIKYLIKGRLDSINIYNTEVAKISLMLENDTENIVNTGNVIIKSNAPVNQIISNRIMWQEGGDQIKPRLINKFSIEVPLNNVNLNKNLIFKKGSIIYESGIENDSTSFIFDFESSQYGSLNLEFINLKNNMILELFNDQTVIKKIKLTNKTKINYIEPGIYKLRVFEDSNNDSSWTPGNIKNNKASESVFIYSDKISIKSNWDIDLLIDLNK